MKSIKSLFLVLFLGLFSFSAMAAKVYSDGTTLTATKKGFINRINEPVFDILTALGMTEGVYTVKVHGENPSISDATPDIWDGDGLINFQADASADILSIASSSASDTVDITIYGLDGSGDALNQTVTLTGTTRAAITGLWRVLSIENDNSTDTVGNVIVYQGTSTIPSLGDTEVRAVILAGNNKSYSGSTTVPNDKVGVITKISAGVINQDGTSNLEFILYSRKYGKDFSILSHANIATPNNSEFNDVLNVPIVLPGLTDIKCSVSDTSTDTAAATCDFEMLIFDEGLIDSTTLGTIGQQGF